MAALFVKILLLLGIPTQVLANLTINMPVGVTDVSQKIYTLHMLVFCICVGIGVVVFGIMFYAIIFHRRAAGHKAVKFHEHKTLEIFWTIIPFIILVVMAIPATKTILEMDDTQDSDLTIKITGFMWRWQYEYIGTKVSFMSDLSTPYEQIINRAEKDEHYLREVNNRLVLPINKKIRFLMTGNDVIHSWWVSDLGVKKDAVPGFINETWARINKVGVYRGQCAELCGARHGFMPIVVEAVSEADFATWLQAQQLAAEQEQPAHSAPATQTAPAPIPAAPATTPNTPAPDAPASAPSPNIQTPAPIAPVPSPNAPTAAHEAAVSPPAPALDAPAQISPVQTEQDKK